jgi:hypothetical protein
VGDAERPMCEGQVVADTGLLEDPDAGLDALAAVDAAIAARCRDA